MGYCVYYGKKSPTDIIEFSNQEFETRFFRRYYDSPLANWSTINKFIYDDTAFEKFLEQNRDKKICFYGTGLWGKSIIEKLPYFDNVVGVFDQNPNCEKCGNYPVLSPDLIPQIKPDIIILTVLYSDEIKEFLTELKSANGLSFEVFNKCDLEKLLNPIPEDLLQDWKNYNHQGCFQTSPSEENLKNVRYIKTDELAEEFVDESYNHINNLIKNNKYTHVFCIRSLELGGAEKEALIYMHSIYKLNPKSKILCICTANVPNFWEDKLPANTDLFNFGQNYRTLMPDEKMQFLYCILKELKAPIVHIINVNFIFSMLQIYGYKLAKISNIYVTLFYVGVLNGYFSNGLSQLLENHDYIYKLFSDNKKYFDHLNKNFYFPAEKFTSFYFPVENKLVDYNENHVKTKLENGENLRILWAGRICRQKRPDILIKIAEKCKHLPVHFDVWGTLEVNYTKSMFDMPNISYNGLFKNGWQFSNKEYDIFLYTSAYDGMPNIVLEALDNALPVITNNSGGVGEIIIDRKTGFLINNLEDIDAYVKVIEMILENPNILGEIIANGKEIIKKQHSEEAFLKSLSKEQNYLYPSGKV